MTDKPFETDGCSAGMSWAWRALTGSPPPWEGACEAHDRAYWAGGSSDMRLAADAQLLATVASGGHPWIAIVMFIAVRGGGHPAWPTSWRWGYGCTMTKQEITMLERIWNWCKRSATIVEARIRLYVGILIAGLIAQFGGYDFTQLVTMDAVSAFKMVLALSLSGVVTEVARRRTL